MPGAYGQTRSGKIVCTDRKQVGRVLLRAVFLCRKGVVRGAYAIVVSTINLCVGGRDSSPVLRLRFRYAQHERDFWPLAFLPFTLSVTAAGGEVEGRYPNT
jgi:hypothetical protein